MFRDRPAPWATMHRRALCRAHPFPPYRRDIPAPERPANENRIAHDRHRTPARPDTRHQQHPDPRSSPNTHRLFPETTVGDNRARIPARWTPFHPQRVILCSGGLAQPKTTSPGESIAALLDRPLVFRPELYSAILNASLSSSAPHRKQQKQAALPEGAIPIENPTASP